jgi:hypothetical protein
MEKLATKEAKSVSQPAPHLELTALTGKMKVELWIVASRGWNSAKRGKK